MKPPTDAIDNLTSSQRQLDFDGSEVGVSRQALDMTLEWVQWAINRIIALEKENDELEDAIIHLPEDEYEDDLEPEGDQW